MRFFYQDEAEKISTKCIRVSSTATTRDVIDTLVDKFHPDMRMLTRPELSLYEVHSRGGWCDLSLSKMNAWTASYCCLYHVSSVTFWGRGGRKADRESKKCIHTSETLDGRYIGSQMTEVLILEKRY